MFSAFQTFGRLGAGARAVAWSPTTLFAAGEKGGLWDFSTLANLYKDSAGTTPCTAVGDPIGLVLDTKNGTPVLGPELAPGGGTFDSATGWNVPAEWSISGGVATHSGTINNLTPSTPILTIGKTYQIQVNILAVPTGFQVSAGGTYSGTGLSLGVNTLRLQCTSDTTLRLQAATGQATVLESISVREIPGNHLTQSTSTKRPTLGRMPATGVRNLLTHTEDFSNAAYGTHVNLSVSANAAAAPDGTNTADLLIENSASGVHFIGQSFLSAISGNSYTISVFAKKKEREWLCIGQTVGTASPINSSRVWFNLTTGTVGTASAGYTGSIASLGNGWYRCTATATFTISSGNAISPFVGISTADNQTTHVGDGASGLYVWGFQLELGSTATAYQRVGDPYDITESGVASVYTAYFDGVDDCLVSPSIDFSGTDAMSVFAGFRKTSDAARGMVAELSATTASNNGSFALTAPNAASATIVYESKGTALTDTSATIAAPADSVIAAVSDISADSNVLRRNGAEAESDTGDQGTGNFGNYPIYVGQRNASSYPYKGFLSALCTRGAATDATTITNMEQWLAARTPGVTLP